MGRSRKSYWVMGAGQFGSRAVERLLKKHPDAVLTAVDRNAIALDRLGRVALHKVCEDAVCYLDEGLNGQGEPNWIVPAVPIHLAFEWVRCRLVRRGSVELIPVPGAVEERLPNPKRGSEGQVFASYADFRCPDHCTEPYELCTWTGKPRKGLLYRRIEEIDYKDFQPVVIRSHQLAPGVGGYQPEALRKALDMAAESDGPVLLATACLCHGILHAFRFS